MAETAKRQGRATPDRQEAEPVEEGGALELRPHWRAMGQVEAMRVFGPEVLERLAEGETLTAICRFATKTDPDGTQGLEPRPYDSFPTRRAVYGWCEYDAEFAGHFAHARALGDEALEDEAIAIAEDNSQDFVPTPFGMRLDTEHVQRAKLRIWTRFQLIDRRKGGGRPGTEAAAKGARKAAPTRILVVGVEPKGVAGVSRVIDGESSPVEREP